jgi:thiol-disulfide isomerase/thioredoxin
MDAIEVSAESLQWTILLALCLTVLAVVLAVLGLAYLVAVLMRRQPPDLGPVVPNAGLAIDSEAPVLVGQEVRTGETVRLSDYAGQVTVVAFVSPTCKPCVDLVRHLNALAKTRRHVRLIVVVLPGSGYDYGRNLGQSIRVLADTDGSRQNSWQVEITPLTYVIDGQGTVKMKSVSNDLLALEDTLDGYGWKQGDRPWVAVEGAQAAELMPPHSPEYGDPQ